jgi:HipA-like C-terminal domain
LVRSIMGRWSGQQPIFVTDAAGMATRWGTLHFLAGQQVLVQATFDGGTAQESLTTGALPWYMAPLKPQGFMGRLRGQQLGYASANPDDWTLEQTLHALLAHEHDAPGAFSVGEEQGALLPEAPLAEALRAAHYDAIAQDVNQTLPAGSSAGGEQPKFVSHLNAPTGYERLIVKFTPPRGTPFGERWHDLLHAECLALQTLAAHGVACAHTRVLHSARRTYLESVRFDRVGRLGKRHVVPLWAVHAQFVGGPQQHWVASCDALAQRGLLSAADAQQVRTLRDFGRLIGNTDMHFGNLSLRLDDVAHTDAPQFSLAPVYDMLPMLWRPSEFRDELGYMPFTVPQAPLGSAQTWPHAVHLAREFWGALAASQNVSASLRSVALAQRTLMENL